MKLQIFDPPRRPADAEEREAADNYRDSNSDGWCGVHGDAELRFMCMRIPGHRGDHVDSRIAHNGVNAEYLILARWPGTASRTTAATGRHEPPTFCENCGSEMVVSRGGFPGMRCTNSNCPYLDPWFAAAGGERRRRARKGRHGKKR